MRWKEIITESVKKYEPMFSVFRDENGTPTWVSKKIRDIEALFKREDRVVWALRWERYMAINSNMPLIRGDREAIKAKFFQDLSGHESDYVAIKEHWSHYASLGAQGIDNLVFNRQSPNEILNHLDTAEKAWQATARQEIDHAKDYPEIVDDEDEDDYDDDDYDDDDRSERKRKIEERSDIEKLIDFGDGWAWWNLNRTYCTREGSAMGHCGNQPSAKPGDQVLSLRRDLGNGKFRPSLTFILHEDGMLGEMKGRANEKPAAKYHPYIIALLKSREVEGCVGGGYAADSNFSLLDLPEQTRDELIRIKPRLLSGIDSLALYKENPSEANADILVNKLESFISTNHFRGVKIDLPKKRLILGQWDVDAYVEREWGTLNRVKEFFDDLPNNLRDLTASPEIAESIAKRARDEYYENIIGSLIHYSHLDYKLEGVGEGVSNGMVTRYVGIPSVFSPRYTTDLDTWDYNDEFRDPDFWSNFHSLDDEEEDEGISGPIPEWSDIKDSLNSDLSEIEYDIAEYAYKEKNQLSVVKTIYSQFADDSQRPQRTSFSRDPRQSAFGFYRDK